MSQSVVTRFAPSPTGFLHIGGVRTAIFSYLHAKHNSGSFRLRIEDTDKKRSTPEAVEALIAGLDWMGLKPDGDIVFQSDNEDRHREVVQQLLASGNAYKCYMTAEELAEAREAAQADGKVFKYDRRWRDKTEADAPKDLDYSVRFKMPLQGETTIEDLVQGSVTVQNIELDDLVIQRADGTPTYNLAVVVDDHDMGVTHVIRGDDHLNNAFRQLQIFKGLGWDVPVQAHIPLIHGHDGAKLSKRHGALGVEAYRDMGFTRPAIFSYLLRLGWSHGDQEVFTEEEAIELFDISNVNKAPSRFDVAKLAHVNGHFMKQMDAKELVSHVVPFLKDQPTADGLARLEKGMSGLVDRADNLVDIAASAGLYLEEKLSAFDEKAEATLKGEAAAILPEVKQALTDLSDWSAEAVQSQLKALSKDKGLKMGAVFMPLRAALCGTMNSPSVPEVAEALGKDLTLQRLEAALTL